MSKLILFFVILVLFVAGCSSNAEKEAITGGACADGDTCSLDSSAEHEINIDKLEIYHFHGTHQCYSCITVGDYAEETVNTYFKDELDKGIIVFGHINGELPENQELVKKYGVDSASLWLGVYDETGFHPEQNTNVWYKISDKEDYMTYLKEIIEQKLAGN